MNKQNTARPRYAFQTKQNGTGPKSTVPAVPADFALAQSAAGPISWLRSGWTSLPRSGSCSEARTAADWRRLAQTGAEWCGWRWKAKTGIPRPRAGECFSPFFFFFLFPFSPTPTPPTQRHRLATRSVKLLEGFHVRVANGRPTGRYQKRAAAQTAPFLRGARIMHGAARGSDGKRSDQGPPAAADGSLSSPESWQARALTACDRPGDGLGCWHTHMDPA